MLALCLTSALARPATSQQALTYPAGTTQQVAGASGTTGAVTASIPADSVRYSYLCDMDVSAAGTAAISPITVTGIGNAGGAVTFTYQGVTAGTVPFIKQWTPCLQSRAPNQAITVTTTADGTATAVNVNLHGYQQ